MSVVRGVGFALGTSQAVNFPGQPPTLSLSWHQPQDLLVPFLNLSLSIPSWRGCGWICLPWEKHGGNWEAAKGLKPMFSTC